MNPKSAILAYSPNSYLLNRISIIEHKYNKIIDGGPQASINYYQSQQNDSTEMSCLTQ